MDDSHTRSYDEAAILAMIDIANDPQFVALRTRANEAPLLYRDFECLPVPPSCDRRLIWELLNTLRRHTAVITPLKDVAGHMGWYSLTESIISDCGLIDQKCCKGSMLDGLIQSHDPVRLFIGQVVDELVTVLAGDGVNIAYEEARRIVSGQETPDSPVQRIVSNIVNLLYDAEDMSRQAIDERFLLDLFKSVVRKAGHSSSFVTERPAGLQDRRVRPWQGVEMSYVDAVGAVISLANGSGVSPSEHPLLLALGIDDAIVQSLPFESLNNTLSWLVGRIVMAKRGSPALGFLPVHHILARWKHDMVRPSSNGLLQAESIILVGDTVDFTGHVAGFVELVREAVFAMERISCAVLEREEDIERSLLANADINYRQRELIQEALRNPASTFRIASHQKAWHVAYATARSDLYGLGNLGMFDMRQEGRALVFVPRPDLLEIVASHWGRRGK